jgi:hypothetical protein
LRPDQANFISKISATKWTGDVDQAIVCQLCKHEALSSNPSPPKTKPNKQKNHNGLAELLKW